ncbi:hypothetical protein LCGC14_2681480 [marine sediment metagenome]|uniref:Uncharacterized protein n=1 Tax=marine sediment metagenome TaxID=412755 RepID=A0A0F9BVZ9_9ZZZZ
MKLWTWVTTIPTELQHLVSVLNKRLKALEGKLRLDDLLLTSVITKTAAYTATASDQTILCNAGSGAFTVTLPAAQGLSGTVYRIKKIDSGGNAVTVDGNASETIDGATTNVLSSQYDVIEIQCDGTSWHIL